MTSTPSRCIVFVGAHHDDNELMAGTIAEHCGVGGNVVSVVMNNGRWARDEWCQHRQH